MQPSPPVDEIKDPRELQTIYQRRFDAMLDYRMEIWSVLVADFFQRYVAANATVLDLGAGYGEFINHVHASRKLAMDLNPKLKERVAPGVEVLLQNCTERWAVPDQSLDVVFTSNFFEHLPDKGALKRTFAQIHRCLKPGGRLVALGPNIRYLHGAYWDFWDHFLCLTDKSVVEGLETNGFRVLEQVPKFLPYSMVSGPKVPLVAVRAYLKLPLLWRVFGRQFLIVATPSC
jgi:SAM-dependent methyltransferase